MSAIWPQDALRYCCLPQGTRHEIVSVVDILDDIREECRKYGNVESLQIPRPLPDLDVPGVGKVFVEFSSVDSAMTAAKAIGGRTFAGRVTISSYLDESKYFAGQFQ
eukprot:m.252271 g.252271  ORF g.252271 m.252271 type:complete len:107 (+) comp54519_c0_seq3:1195-1515(+)